MENDYNQSLFARPGMLASTLLTGVTTFLVVFGLSKLYRARKQKQEREIHLKEFDGPPGQWFVGHLNHLTFDDAMLDKFVKWATDYGGTHRIKLFGDDFLLVAEPKNMAAVLKTAGPKDKVAYSLLSQWIGQGILTSDGPHWFRNRRLLTPAFHFEVLKPYTEVFQQAVTDLIKGVNGYIQTRLLRLLERGTADIVRNTHYMKNGLFQKKWKKQCNGKQATFEMFEHFSLMTLDSLLKTAFSTTTDCQNIGKKHPYINAVYQISDATMARLNSLFLRNDFFFYNLTSQGWETRRALKVAKQFTYDIVRKKKMEKMEKQATRQGKYRDFVDMLLDAKDDEGNGLTDNEILDEVDTFMFAGHDTTASGLSWFMYHMAKHPEFQERCRDEINDVLAGHSDLTWVDLPKLDYLTMCIKESLRLHGPVANVGRYLTEDLKLADGRIAPAGTFVWTPFVALHRNPAVWENPEEFDPNRFSTENSQGRHSHAYVPFSAGPRNCIGQHFALNELKIVAAQVLKNFHVDLDSTRSPKRVVSLVLRSANGVWLKLRPL